MNVGDTMKVPSLNIVNRRYECRNLKNSQYERTTRNNHLIKSLKRANHLMKSFLQNKSFLKADLRTSLSFFSVEILGGDLLNILLAEQVIPLWMV
jgi:hypothetical protein